MCNFSHPLHNRRGKINANCIRITIGLIALSLLSISNCKTRVRRFSYSAFYSQFIRNLAVRCVAVPYALIEDNGARRAGLLAKTEGGASGISPMTLDGMHEMWMWVGDTMPGNCSLTAPRTN